MHLWAADVRWRSRGYYHSYISSKHVLVGSKMLFQISTGRLRNRDGPGGSLLPSFRATQRRKSAVLTWNS